MSFVLKALVEYPDGKSETVEFDKTPIVIGRIDTNDLCIKHPSISRTHAQVSLHEQILTVEDFGSSNGTCVSGARISEITTIGSSQYVHIGDVKITFVLPDELVQTQIMQAFVEPAQEQATQIITGIQEFTEIQIHEPNEDPIMMVLAKDVTSVGRAETNDIHIKDPAASREHINIVREDSKFSFCAQPNCSSQVLHNSKIVDRGVLEPGDKLQLGHTILTFHPNAQQDKRRKKLSKHLQWSLVGLIVVALATVGWSYNHYYSGGRIAEQSITQAEIMFKKGQHFSAIESLQVASEHKKKWTKNQKMRFYQILSLSSLRQGITLLKSNRIDESLTYFEQSTSAASKDSSLQDIALRVEQSIFENLNSRLRKQILENNIEEANHIHSWLEPLYRKTHQKELARLDILIRGNVAVKNYEEELAKALKGENKAHSVTWLTKCFDDTLADSDGCNLLVESYHNEVYTILNQKSSQSQLSTSIQSAELQTLLDYSKMLVKLKPQIAKYQRLHNQFEIFLNNVLAKEKLKSELSDDELNLEDFD